jgi:hypothetical protein
MPGSVSCQVLALLHPGSTTTLASGPYAALLPLAVSLPALPGLGNCYMIITDSSNLLRGASLIEPPSPVLPV